MPRIRFQRLFLPVLVLSLVVCRRQPGEPVFVITSDSYSVRGDSAAVIAPETIAVMIPDTLATPDTVSADTLESVLPGATVYAFRIHGSLYSSAEAAGVEDPDVFSAHVVRCLWWRLDPWTDICAGDSICVLYADSQGEIENRTIALYFSPAGGQPSGSFGVYQFRKSGDHYPSYFYSDGTEIAELLNTLPVSTFEEITGIYGEPRGDHEHAGIDFKAPEGTPVRTARGGSVVRTNWNSAYNGNCLEISMGGGYGEIFLHLRELAPQVSVGAQLQAGAVIGSVGNTGRSYSAHLHYQINDENGYPIDPILFFGTSHRSLDGADLRGFRAFVDLCNRAMAGG